VCDSDDHDDLEDDDMMTAPVTLAIKPLLMTEVLTMRRLPVMSWNREACHPRGAGDSGNKSDVDDGDFDHDAPACNVCHGQRGLPSSWGLCVKELEGKTRIGDLSLQAVLLYERASVGATGLQAVKDFLISLVSDCTIMPRTASKHHHHHHHHHQQQQQQQQQHQPGKRGTLEEPFVCGLGAADHPRTPPK
jgi:hypothetical protein